MANGHGGARPGSGPKATPIDEKRVYALRDQGLSLAAVAARFGVGQRVIRRVVKKRPAK